MGCASSGPAPVQVQTVKSMKSVNLTETRIEPLDLTDEPIQMAPRLKDGFYHSSVHTNTLIKIEGNSFHFNLIYDYPTLVPVGTAKIAYGNFGPVSKEVKAGSGQENYNFQFFFGESAEENHLGTFGVVMPNGNKFWTHFDGELDCLEFKTDAELRNMNAEKEHIDDLSCPYKIQPENQGKVLWISGPTGSGKSVLAQMLAKEAGYVYFEADCLCTFVNPYVPMDAEDIKKAVKKQKPIKGLSKDWIEAYGAMGPIMERYVAGEWVDGFDFSPAYPFYKILAQEIDNQRKRIGGDFAIATEVPSKDLRAVIRESLPESHFVYLNLDEEAQESRFEAMKKHFSPEEIKDGMPKYITSAYKDKSPTENVEENVSVINVTGEMTPKEVMENCLNQI